jgi:hypothetical protein
MSIWWPNDPPIRYSDVKDSKTLHIHLTQPDCLTAGATEDLKATGAELEAQGFRGWVCHIDTENMKQSEEEFAGQGIKLHKQRFLRTEPASQKEEKKGFVWVFRGKKFDPEVIKKKEEERKEKEAKSENAANEVKA